MTTYKFERLSSLNLHHLVYLYDCCFNYKTSVSFLKLKYATGIFGGEFIGYLAFEDADSQPAAYYGVFPILCQLNTTKILGAQSGDTMTHPNHQGKGLFTKLALKTFELAKKEGIEFIFGFPNSNSYPGFIKKLNWRHYSDINNFSINTNMVPFDKLAKKFSLLSIPYVIYTESKLNNYLTSEIIPNSLQLQSTASGFVVHDANFYQYKSYYKFYKIKLSKASCIVKVDGRLWVGDISYCNRSDFIHTVNELKSLAKKIGCSTVQFSFFNGTEYDTYMRTITEIKSKNPVCCLALNAAINPEIFKFQSVDFDTY